MSEPRSSRGPLVVTSLQNERVKAIRALDMRKERKATGLFVAEGASILMTAREHGWTPNTLVALPDVLSEGVAKELARWTEQSGGDVMAVSQAVLASIGLEALGLGPIEAPTLGMTIYWAILNGAVINRWWWWWAPPIFIIVFLFVGLFLVSQGLDEWANPRLRRSI